MSYLENGYALSSAPEVVGAVVADVVRLQTLRNLAAKASLLDARYLLPHPSLVGIYPTLLSILQFSSIVYSGNEPYFPLYGVVCGGYSCLSNRLIVEANTLEQTHREALEGVPADFPRAEAIRRRKAIIATHQDASQVLQTDNPSCKGRGGCGRVCYLTPDQSFSGFVFQTNAPKKGSLALASDYE